MGHVQQCLTSTVNSDSQRFNDKITILQKKLILAGYISTSIRKIRTTL